MIRQVFDLMLQQHRQNGAVKPELCDWWDARSTRHETWGLPSGVIVSVQHTSPEGTIYNMRKLYAGILNGYRGEKR
jgi:hypothetical protein